MDRGERLNKTGDSWFSSKTIEVVRREVTFGGRALLWLGGRYRLTKPWQTPNTEECDHGRQSTGANVRGQEGNNPDRQLRSRISAKWKTRWEGLDSQEVGLEAAIL